MYAIQVRFWDSLEFTEFSTGNSYIHNGGRYLVTAKLYEKDNIKFYKSKKTAENACKRVALNFEYIIDARVRFLENDK